MYRHGLACYDIYQQIDAFYQLRMNPLIHKKISIIGDCEIVKAATLPYCGATLNTVAEMDIDISPNRVLRVLLETSHIHSTPKLQQTSRDKRTQRC